MKPITAKIFGLILGLGYLGACSNEATDIRRTQENTQPSEFDSVGVSFKAGTQAAALLELPMDVVGDGNRDAANVDDDLMAGDARSAEDSSTPDSNYDILPPSDGPDIESPHITIMNHSRRPCVRGSMTVTLYRLVAGTSQKVEDLSTNRICRRMAVGLSNLTEGEQYVVAMDVAGAMGQIRYAGVSKSFKIEKGTLARVDLMMRRVKKSSDLDAIVRVQFEK